MNRQTIAALNGLNRRFYRLHSDDFSRTRGTPWPGWERVVSKFHERRATVGFSRPVSIVDVGCGNGRFLPFLEDRIQGTTRFVGVDSSLPLLVEARRGTVASEGLDRAVVAADLVTDRALGCLRSGHFDLAVSFGLLHHVPGNQSRLQLLTDLATSLRPGGVMAVSFWQFGEQQRFIRRSISWENYNSQAVERIDTADLEEGDMLLAWGELPSGDTHHIGSAVRYCHFTNPSEADQLISCLSMNLVDRFLSDGEGERLNLYYLLQKPQ